MGMREYRDGLRETWLSNKELAPTRTIVYTRSSDDTSSTLESTVTGAEFNQDLADDKKVNRVTFGSLLLEEEPTRTDTILSDGKTFIVREWEKFGTLYKVSAESNKRNKVSSRTFK